MAAAAAARAPLRHKPAFLHLRADTAHSVGMYGMLDWVRAGQWLMGVVRRVVRTVEVLSTSWRHKAVSLHWQDRCWLH